MVKRSEIAILLLVIAIAAGFRLYGLHANMPPGLTPEEAISGNAAITAWEQGQWAGPFVELQAVSVHYLGNTAYALRLVSALIGILTVLGTYLLTRRLFDNWELAAMAAFLMAIGSWHVLFSRIGLSAITAPLCAVWALYYVYTAMRTNRLWHWAVAGAWLGLGFQAHASFQVMPLVIVIIIITYLVSLRSDFQHDKYLHTRHQLWGGMALMVGVMVLIILPTIGSLYTHSEELIGPSGASVFSSTHPWQDLSSNIVRTLGMFIFHGDADWQHGIHGQTALYWLVAALFAVGFIRSFLKIGRTMRTHGHPSTVQMLLVSWLFIGLIPAFLVTQDTPNALRALLVAPVVSIMAAEGLWWLFTWMRHWYDQRDVHHVCLPGPHGHRYCMREGTLIATFTLVALLTAIGVAEASRYFVDWAPDPDVAKAFSQRYTDSAERLNSIPPATLKYVVIRSETSAQPIMFLTDTATLQKQKSHNLYYITETQFDHHQYTKGALIIQLDP